jgi:hypothetical protein
MLRLLALAAHFSPLNPGPYDPAVVELINAYFQPEPPKMRASVAVAPCSTPADAISLKAA